MNAPLLSEAMGAARDVQPEAPRVALVTGASRGLGRLIAFGLAKAGIQVVACGRDIARTEDTVAHINQSGGEAHALSFDVTRPGEVAGAVEAAHTRFGPIDLLVNNAGEGGPIDLAWRSNPQAWWRTFETNLRGSFLCMHSVLPQMVQRRRGIVVNIASHAGIERWVTCSAYSVSKAALIALTDNVAAETHRSEVSVFAYHPGLMAIGLTEPMLASPPPSTSPAGKVAEWFRSQLESGALVDPTRSIEALMKLVSGRYHALSGSYLTPDDDLDALAREMAEDGRRSRRRLRLSV